MSVYSVAVSDVDAALLEGVDKVAPVEFCLGERAGSTENHTLGVVASDTDGYGGCAVADRTVESDLDVGGV